MKLRRPALFLDRDGTLIKEVNYLNRIDQIQILEGAIQALALARDAGLATVLVTNQSAIARGMLTESELQAIHSYLSQEIAQRGAQLEAVYYCPHHPEGSVPEYAVACGCRKPQPGLLLAAAEELGLDPARSLMVGDCLHDVEAGHRAGCCASLVMTGYGVREASLSEIRNTYPDQISSDLLAAVRWFLDRRSG